MEDEEMTLSMFGLIDLPKNFLDWIQPPHLGQKMKICFVYWVVKILLFLALDSEWLKN